jgi:hypothetical protein
MKAIYRICSVGYYNIDYLSPILSFCTLVPSTLNIYHLIDHLTRVYLIQSFYFAQVINQKQKKPIFIYLPSGVFLFLFFLLFLKKFL